MPSQKTEPIIVVGAGLVGSLLATMLSRQGFQVLVYEKRPDPRTQQKTEGRSINLALSHRGIKALKYADLFGQVEPLLTPMYGRRIHDTQGKITFQSYGTKGQKINSVSRGGLNNLLINAAESAGARFYFQHTLSHVDFSSTTCFFDDGETATGQAIFGTDGAFSAVRQIMQKTDRFNFSQYYIPHGYKELRLDPVNGDFAMEPNGLHIWPRGNFMLIALPNPDKSFTCTLFFPFEGDLSFESLDTDDKIKDFFTTYFSDLPITVNELIGQFHESPTSSLVTIRCYPWAQQATMLLGDASHAIVPFYGQGMNAGFEDVRLLVEMASPMEFQWEDVFSAFQQSRKKDADAIADLALKNFKEMRDWVGDETFLERKKIEAQMFENFPDQWIPQYSMVTFSDIPYAQALEKGNKQEQIVEDFLKKENSGEISLNHILRVLSKD